MVRAVAVLLVPLLDAVVVKAMVEVRVVVVGGLHLRVMTEPAGTSVRCPSSILEA